MGRYNWKRSSTIHTMALLHWDQSPTWGERRSLYHVQNHVHLRSPACRPHQLNICWIICGLLSENSTDYLNIWQITRQFCTPALSPCSFKSLVYFIVNQFLLRIHIKYVTRRCCNKCCVTLNVQHRALNKDESRENATCLK